MSRVNYISHGRESFKVTPSSKYFMLNIKNVYLVYHTHFPYFRTLSRGFNLKFLVGIVYTPYTKYYILIYQLYKRFHHMLELSCFFLHNFLQWPIQEPKLEVPTIQYKAYFSGLNFREYPHKIRPYMVQSLHFRLLKCLRLQVLGGHLGPLNCAGPSTCAGAQKSG